MPAESHRCWEWHLNGMGIKGTPGLRMLIGTDKQLDFRGPFLRQLASFWLISIEVRLQLGSLIYQASRLSMSSMAARCCQADSSGQDSTAARLPKASTPSWHERLMQHPQGNQETCTDCKVHGSQHWLMFHLGSTPWLGACSA